MKVLNFMYILYHWFSEPFGRKYWNPGASDQQTCLCRNPALIDSRLIILYLKYFRSRNSEEGLLAGSALTIIEQAYLRVQSTLVISKSKGPSETLRDIRTSTHQICRIEENTSETI